MKISIISVTFNAASTIREMLDSVAAQTHRNIEHLVIDGGSSDGTVELIRRHGARVSVLVSEPDKGTWDAMNKGLRLATGDIVGFLNADDEFIDDGVVARIADVMKDVELDACYADLIYVARDEPQRMVRDWVSEPFRPGLFLKGWMPAHPTFYARRSLFDRYGGFDLRFPLQSDFELAMRLLEVHRIRARYVPEYWVRMRSGGQSNASLGRVLRGNWEAYQIARHHGLPVSRWYPVTKILSRLPQFLSQRWQSAPDRIGRPPQ
jgi:glycosyltransferase involved in cell wall biosynthesis